MTTMQERAAKVAEEHARSYGAIDNSRTTDQRSRDYACEKALLTVAETIRALSPDPTRAALEECVRAMEPFRELWDELVRVDGAQNCHDGITLVCVGEDKALYYEHLRIATAALVTARNALEGK